MDQTRNDDGHLVALGRLASRTNALQMLVAALFDGLVNPVNLDIGDTRPQPEATTTRTYHPIVLYLIGGPPRVGKSALALALLRQEGIPWLPTDTIRTVLRQVVPAIDEVDAGFPPPEPLARLMRPFIERTIDVCLAQSPEYLIEGVEIVPSDVAAYGERFGETRSCFLGNEAMSAEDLRAYRGHNAWHEGYDQAQLEKMAGWIRRWSDELAEACRVHDLSYLDLGSWGFEEGIARGVAVLLVDR